MIGLRDVLVVAPAATFHPQHHHHHGHHHNVDATAALLSPADHPIIPLLTTAPCLPDEPDRGRVPAGINLWQSQPPQQPAAWPQQSPYLSAGAPSSSSYLCKPMPVPVLDSAAVTTAAGGVVLGGCNPSARVPGMGGLMAVGVVGVGDGMSSFLTCQDCGNKAKKDCVHRRCRTCCKSRGFDCSTHVKSTWVPASHRRDRQVSSSAAAQPGAGGGAGQGSSASTSAAKKPRLSNNDQTATTNTTSTSNTTTTPPRSFDTSSSHQDAGFRQSLPGQVRAPAVFKCVRVTTMDDGEDEYAYQAMVRIGGHIFKGFLYDQGAAEEAADANANSLDCSLSGDPNNDVRRNGGNINNAAGNNRTSGGMIPNISELHLGGGGAMGGGGGAAGGGTGGASVAYAAAGLGDGLMGGTAYGNPIN